MVNGVGSSTSSPAFGSSDPLGGGKPSKEGANSPLADLGDIGNDKLNLSSPGEKPPGASKGPLAAIKTLLAKLKGPSRANAGAEPGADPAPTPGSKPGSESI